MIKLFSDVASHLGGQFLREERRELCAKNIPLLITHMIWELVRIQSLI